MISYCLHKPCLAFARKSCISRVSFNRKCPKFGGKKYMALENILVIFDIYGFSCRFLSWTNMNGTVL